MNEIKKDMLKLHFDENFDIEEYSKIIGFISLAITDYKVHKDYLIVYYDNHIESIDHLRDKIIKSMQRFVGSKRAGKPDFIAKNEGIKTYFSHQQVLNGEYVQSCGDGIIMLRNEAVLLFEYFDSVFRNFAIQIGAAEERYPVLLPIKTYSDTGYLRNSSQYSMFCNEAVEDIELLKEYRNVKDRVDKSLINQSKYALSPSACFHVYETYRDKTLTKNCSITICQSVFRNEGRFNWKDFARLRDYHVREIVFIGNNDYVESSRKTIMNMTKDYMNQIDLFGTIQSSSDHFIIPQMQKFKLIQMQEKLKYEWRLFVGESEDIAVASFNLHGTNFTKPFGIKVGEDETVTGCVGFGLERIVLAFLSQYGFETLSWPEEIRNYCRKDS